MLYTGNQTNNQSIKTTCLKNIKKQETEQQEQQRVAQSLAKYQVTLYALMTVCINIYIIS